MAAHINDFDPAKARHGVYEFLTDRLDAGLQRIADFIESWHGRENGRVTCFMAPHAPENCSPDLLRRARAMAEHYDIGYTVHLSQSHREVEAVVRTRGVKPTQYLFANDFLGPRRVVAHGRYLDEAGVGRLGRAGATRARVVLVDPAPLGLELTAFIALRTDRHEPVWLEKFTRAVADLPEILGAWRTSGDLDYLLMARVADVRAYDRLYQRLIRKVELADISASFVMEEIKETTALPVDLA